MMDLIREKTKVRENSRNYHICKWEPVKAFYKTYKYTGFMRLTKVYRAVHFALQASRGN